MTRAWGFASDPGQGAMQCHPSGRPTRSTRTEENDSELNSSFSKLAAVRSLTRHAAPLLLVLKWLESKLRQ